MQRQLEFHFNWKPGTEEGVKPLEAFGVVEPDPADSAGDLTNGEASMIECILSSANMDEAIAKVRSNRGAPGIDGVPVKDLPDYMAKNYDRISDEIRRGKYKPLPVRRVEIPKPNGGTRMLGIPSARDRVIQQAVLQVLTPVFDPWLSERGYTERWCMCGIGGRCSAGWIIESSACEYPSR